ncbi:hypothetical protein BG004_003026 [Podila humilis]|nr:hypothetical protein BG004_003026 [Podila humilis]
MLILRPLFSLMLALGLLVLLLLVIARSFVHLRSEIQQRFVCNLPLVSHLVRCNSPSTSSSPESFSGMIVPNFAELVSKQAKSYEILADSLNTLKSEPKKRGGWKKNGQKDGEEQEEEQQLQQQQDPYGMSIYVKGKHSLPLLLKRSELAVVDLKVLVKHSSLAEPSKQLLVEQLEAFHTRAKLAGRKIQFLQARANGCVDGLVIRNVYLTIELDRLEEEQQILKAHRESRWGKVWNLLYGSNVGAHMAVTELKLHGLYRSTMNDARDHIRDLIVQAQDILHSLDALDQILMSIREITTKEKSHQVKEQDRTLAQLWSRLGGNRLEKNFYRTNLELLQDMELERKATVGQIQAALWKLTDFEAEIGILREKLVGASIQDDLEQKTPIEGDDERSSQSLPLPEEMRNSNNNDNSQAQGTTTTPKPLPLNAMTLRAHIVQIDLVTTRLKERSFLADVHLDHSTSLRT